MVDFMTALKAAKLEASNFAGNSGNTGNTEEKNNEGNKIRKPELVATAECAVATVATNSTDVATVATADVPMATSSEFEISEKEQQLRELVANVANVATENHDFGENLAIRRADLRNSLAFHEPQFDLNHCFVCGGREDPDRLFIAVMTPRPGANHWLHADCHPEHIRRCAERRNA